MRQGSKMEQGLRTPAGVDVLLLSSVRDETQSPRASATASDRAKIFYRQADFGIHLIDILNYILDKKPDGVFCKKLNYLSKEREDCAFITLTYDQFIANLEMSWLHPLKQRDIWVIGSKAKVYADLFEQILIKYPITITENKSEKLPELNLEINKNEPLKEELKAFCEAIKNKSYNNFEGQEEILTTKICELALKSAVEGKEFSI